MSYGVVGDPEFSQRPFVAGTLDGIRCFRLDNLGRLNAMQQFPKPVWTPGENKAACHRQWSLDQDSRFYTGIPASIWSSTSTMMMRSFADYPGGSPRVPKHPVADLECTCGFYAYFDTAHNPHVTTDSIMGVIEGYGLVTAGDRGFRASKARIKALMLPTSNRSAPMMRVAVNYGDIPIFSSIEAMVEKHPLALPSDVPTPDSIPDFWTRSA